MWISSLNARLPELYWQSVSGRNKCIRVRDLVRSIILLVHMVGPSFMFVALIKLNVSESEHWVTWSQYALDNVIKPSHKIKEYILFKHMITVVKTICVETCFEVTPSNKNISCDICRVILSYVIWLVGYTITKYFLSKRKSPLQLDMRTWTVWRFHQQSVYKIIFVQLVGYWNHKIFAFETLSSLVLNIQGKF